jgi:hypothetical protein
MYGDLGHDGNAYPGPLADPPRGRSNGVVMALGLALLAVTIAAIAFALRGRDSADVLSEVGASAPPGAGCRPVRDLGPEEQAGHVTDSVEYTTSPPHSGRHNSMPLPAGRRIVARETAPELVAERAVHNLEHAYVVVWYGPGVSDDDVDKAGDAARETGLRKVIVVPWYAPFDDGAAPFVMASWGYLQACDGVPDAAAITAFWNGYAGPNGRAPEKEAQ